MDKKKLDFITLELSLKLKSLDSQAKGQWGRMNVQQMIEHMSDSFREASGKIPRTIVTSAEKLPLMKGFLLSEKEFKPNTKNVLMAEEPLPVRNKNIQEALTEFDNEIRDFKNYYTENPESIITNPFFGDLNYSEWVQLLHKHAVHHLKQFGAEIE